MKFQAIYGLLVLAFLAILNIYALAGGSDPRNESAIPASSDHIELPGATLKMEATYGV